MGVATALPCEVESGGGLGRTALLALLKQLSLWVEVLF